MSPRIDSGVGLTHCSRTCRVRRCPSILRMWPGQFQRWCLARITTSTEGCRASSAMTRLLTAFDIFGAHSARKRASSDMNVISIRSRSGTGHCRRDVRRVPKDTREKIAQGRRKQERKNNHPPPKKSKKRAKKSVRHVKKQAMHYCFHATVQH